MAMVRRRLLEELGRLVAEAVAVLDLGLGFRVILQLVEASDVEGVDALVLAEVRDRPHEERGVARVESDDSLEDLVDEGVDLGDEVLGEVINLGRLRPLAAAGGLVEENAELAEVLRVGIHDEVLRLLPFERNLGVVFSGDSHLRRPLQTLFAEGLDLFRVFADVLVVVLIVGDVRQTRRGRRHSLRLLRLERRRGGGDAVLLRRRRPQNRRLLLVDPEVKVVVFVLVGGGLGLPLGLRRLRLLPLRLLKDEVVLLDDAVEVVERPFGLCLDRGLLGESLVRGRQLGLQPLVGGSLSL
mmetsp:Transcript_33866/g.108246  ORF Transcript_33866/g.108246 Transcript_33866/m.108246 type:complete len:298 (+) Transcript_33866:773-1666(+)